MRWLLLSVGLAACASAGKGNSIIGGITDAGLDPADASVLDASADAELDAASLIQLTQTRSHTTVPNNSIACRVKGQTLTREATYSRVFPAGDFGVPGVVHVSRVDIAVQSSDSGTAATEFQLAQLQLGLYEGELGRTTLDPGAIVPLGPPIGVVVFDSDAGYPVPTEVDVDVSAGQNLIVSLTTPDGQDTGGSLVIASNADGETRPGYLTATACGFAVPTSIHSITSQIGHGEVDILMSITGHP
jgi:hypothetical protein